MHGSSRRVQPANGTSRGKLLGAERKREDHFRVAKVLLDAVVIVPVDNLDLGKVRAQFFRKPGRHIPQFQRMLNHNQELYRMILQPFPHPTFFTRRSAPVISLGSSTAIMPSRVGEMSRREPPGFSVN